VNPRSVVLLAVGAFALALPLGAVVVRYLRAMRVGKHIREDELGSHQVKEGTPTMGGIIFLLPLLGWLVVLLAGGYGRAWPVLLALAAFAGLGAFDDISGLRDRGGVGWRARTKFPCQLALALAVGVALHRGFGLDSVRIPGTGVCWALGLWFVPVAALVIAGMANAVNLTDGLDGLAGGTMAIALVAYGVICYVAGLVQEASMCSVLAGGLLAFLWYNGHPAQVFMGDVGSLALGATLATIALMSGHLLVLPLVGIIFVLEALSVIAQVGYFKYTKRKYGAGRRIIRMAPLHYHFEMGGWPETRVTQRFTLLALLGALCGVAWVLV
jgi:phospho-N-acetylmuramoyl-pentapeptide-transferase